MSADLLDLDAFYTKPQLQAFNSQTFGQPLVPASSTPVPLQPTTTDDDDDDGWGDFAEATPPAPQKPTELPIVRPVAGQTAQSTISATTRTVRSNTLDILTNSLVNLDSTESSNHEHVPTPSTSFYKLALSSSQAATPVPAYSQFHRGTPAWPQRSSTIAPTSSLNTRTVPGHTTKSSDPNVLFDADDFANDEFDDEFGDFEGPITSSQTAPTSNHTQVPSMPSFDLLSLDSAFESKPVPTSSSASAFSTLAPAVSNTSLLNFGVISPSATLVPKTTSKQVPPGLSMNTLLSTPSPPGLTSTYPHAPRSPSFHERNPYPSLSLKTPTQSVFDAIKKQDIAENSASPVTAWPSNEHSTVDEWPAFEDLPDNPPNVKGLSKTTNPEISKPQPDVLTQKPVTSKLSAGIDWEWQAMEPTASIIVSQNGDSTSPPVNIPPPSVLMSLFPGLFEIANKSLFKPLTGQSAASKKLVMEDERTIVFLKGYLLIATVSARIIAGRKVRWHRDKFLSQSMTISAAGSKGMKLAGVDKAQSVREDREAADVVSSWKIHVGRLRSAVASSNSAPSMRANPPLRIPELSESMTIETAKMVPTASRACVLCGLKRDERILKVDYEVEDSFGEWWVEYWGHRACKNFWETHEKALRSR